MKKFLTAEWKDLLMANYEVDPGLLRDRVPHGTELDFHEGRCFASLVAFKFRNTRVLGIPVPFHINFYEVNLRFYVTYSAEGEIRRGVVFVKEIVPRTAITFVARTLYGEPYETWKMSGEGSGPEMSYGWSKNGLENSVDFTLGDAKGVPEEGSEGEFIIEHYWGYTARGEGRTDEYKVEHPKWNLVEVDSCSIDVDFGKTYGDRFDLLNSAEPHSVVFAEGSEIAVYKGKQIT